MSFLAGLLTVVALVLVMPIVSAMRAARAVRKTEELRLEVEALGRQVAELARRLEPLTREGPEPTVPMPAAPVEARAPP